MIMMAPVISLFAIVGVAMVGFQAFPPQEFFRICIACMCLHVLAHVARWSVGGWRYFGHFCATWRRPCFLCCAWVGRDTSRCFAGHLVR